MASEWWARRKSAFAHPTTLADDREGTADSVERLMGTKAQTRFAFISDKAEFASEVLLDVQDRGRALGRGSCRPFPPAAGRFEAIIGVFAYFFSDVH